MGIEDGLCRARRMIGKISCDYRHLPDGISRPVSAFTGWTIGISRMFFIERILILGLRPTKTAILVLPYKATHKYLSVSKVQHAGSGPPAFENLGIYNGFIGDRNEEIRFEITNESRGLISVDSLVKAAFNLINPCRSCSLLHQHESSLALTQ